ncbi:hypothetical protein [Neobacillus jeddahensis]|uniref:hypothetical protein n=1 Tax=Neobacillus jeddahensis TaxID=1461580 RepID=UPI000AF74080|nr:hypothetical protein [Neobacillus jeddahensis]
MSKKTLSVERIFTDPKLAFAQVIKAIIDNKIEELVNTANKVNTATSQSNDKEHDAS